MDVNVRFIFNIIKSVLSDKRYIEVPQDADWEKICLLCAQHGLESFFAHAFRNGVCTTAPDDVKKLFDTLFYRQIVIDENQKKAIEELFGCFDKHEIDYLPLKGVTLKKLYPSPEMRRMGDADILIRSSQYDKIKKVMKALEYEFVLESNHEYVFKRSPLINVELHKFLIPSYDDDMYRYYNDGWSLAERKGETHRFSLTHEDNYVYIMTHFAKHYRDGGAGIKYLVDLYLFKNYYTDLDFEYINSQFAKLGIDAFAKNVDTLLNVWFDGVDGTALTDSMTDYIVSSGEYGTSKNAAIARTIRDNKDKSFDKMQKRKYVRVIFPSYRTMKDKYHVLEKVPVLLPLFYLFRIASNAFKFDNIKRVKSNNDFVTTETISDFHLHIKEAGLDIYNGREDK